MSSANGTLCNVRLATSQAGLLNGWLNVLGLPEPSQPVKAASSQRVNLSDGGQALRGFESVTLFWDRLEFQQARVLRKLVEDAGNNVLYVTADGGWDGSRGLGNYVDYSGRAHIPELVPVPSSDGLVYDSVTLFINNLAVVADPATGV
jgi:hypothetical protein